MEVDRLVEEANEDREKGDRTECRGVVGVEAFLWEEDGKGRVDKGGRTRGISDRGIKHGVEVGKEFISKSVDKLER